MQRALDAPASDTDGNGRRLTKREMMIRGLVERSAGSDLAATKLLLELLHKADPRALAPDPDAAAPFEGDALSQLKERLARLAHAQRSAEPSSVPPDIADRLAATDAAADPGDPAESDDTVGITDAGLTQDSG